MGIDTGYLWKVVVEDNDFSYLVKYHVDGPVHKIGQQLHMVERCFEQPDLIQATDGGDKENNPGYLEWAVKLTHPGSVIVVDNVIREGAILSPDQDAVLRGTRRVLELMGEHPGLDTAVLQTVGAKHWDGVAFALVK